MLRDGADVEDQLEGASVSFMQQSGSIMNRQVTAENKELLSSKCAWLVQLLLLTAALGAYTFGPLLANWSVVVAVPPEAEFTTVTPPVRSLAKTAAEWYGVDLAYQPGSTKLYVSNVINKSLAARLGVLPGDVVIQGVQYKKEANNTGVKSVFKWDSKKLSPEESKLRMLEMKRFMETPPNVALSDLEWLDPLTPLSVRFDMEHVDVKKGDPYFPVSIVVMRNLCGATLLSSVHLIRGGKLGDLFRPSIVKILVVPALGWTLADVFEILANGKLNAALYSVLSQSRLVGTALLMRIIMGTQQSLLQMLLLTSVTIVILVYVQVPSSVQVGHYWNGFGKPYDPDSTEIPEQDDPLGLAYAFLKIGLSMLMGVIGQKALQLDELKEMPLITLQACIWTVAFIPITILMLVYMWGVGWEHGLLGGATVEFRHCLKSWDAATCNSQVPVIVDQGWDYRTCVVVVFYIYRELCINGVLRMFNALIKNLVNAGATVAIYFMSLALLGKEFNLAQCGLVLAIMLCIAEYALAPKAEAVKEVSVSPGGTRNESELPGKSPQTHMVSPCHVPGRG